jgi:hypothetical protein
LFEFRLLGKFLEDFDYLDENLGDNNNESSNSHCREIQKKRGRLLPFYAKRMDILEYFADEKVRRIFRFDRPSIQIITDTMLLYYFSSL